MIAAMPAAAHANACAAANAVGTDAVAVVSTMMRDAKAFDRTLQLMAGQRDEDGLTAAAALSTDQLAKTDASVVAMMQVIVAAQSQLMDDCKAAN